MVTTLREKQKEMVRRELIRAGKQLFEVQGFETTTINEIVKAAGVAKGTFYNYFESKEELALAALYEPLEGEDEFLRRLHTRHENTFDRITAVITFICDWIEGRPELVWVWFREKLRVGPTTTSQTGDQAVRHKSRMTTLRRYLLTVLEQGQEASEVNRDRSPLDLALDLEGILMHRFIRWYHGKADQPLSEVVLPAIGTYLRGALDADDESSRRSQGRGDD